MKKQITKYPPIWRTSKLLITNHGFTTLEIIVSLLIFTIAISLVGSMYIISQKSYNKGSAQAELTQNSRVSLDRISREIRQSVDIVTVLPETNANPKNEIFFQDGHDVSQITYLRYYLNGADLMRRHTAYYFAGEPDTYVTWGSVDGLGDPPEELILEDRVVGEYFDNIEFWGSNGLIHITIELSKNQNNLKIEASVFSRN